MSFTELSMQMAQCVFQAKSAIHNIGWALKCTGLCDFKRNCGFNFQILLNFLCKKPMVASFPTKSSLRISWMLPKFQEAFGSTWDTNAKMNDFKTYGETSSIVNVYNTIRCDSSISCSDCLKMCRRVEAMHNTNIHYLIGVRFAKTWYENLISDYIRK